MKTATDLLPAIQARALLLDGAMGTELHARGLAVGAPPELWATERPEIVTAIHQAYLEAGSDILLTNTFGANRLRLGVYGAERRVRELNAAAWRLAAAVAARAGRPVWVAGSVGPCGRSTTFRQAVEVFSEQVQALGQGGCTLFVLETMQDLEEVRAAVTAVAEYDPRLPVIVMMTFGQDGRVAGGESPETVVQVVERLSVFAVGANCSFGPEALVPVIERMAKTTTRPLIAKPNAGLPDTLSPEAFAAWGERLVAAGARLIGGCCGTTPVHLQRLAARLRTRPSRWRRRASRQASLPTLNHMEA